MSRGDIDYYVPKPWRSPDEFFHRTVAEFLHEWSRLGDATPKELVVVGFTAPADQLERFYYGFSVLHCLPVGMVGEGAAGTGTVMRAETVRGYAAQAGFGRFEVLGIENDFYRFYRLAA